MPSNEKRKILSRESERKSPKLRRGYNELEMSYLLFTQVEMLIKSKTHKSGIPRKSFELETSIWESSSFRWF